MPLYEYQCHRCSQRFEELVSASSTPSCPSCGGDDLEKLPSAFAVGGSRPEPRPAGPCSSCGDPRGPGACRFGSG